MKKRFDKFIDHFDFYFTLIVMYIVIGYRSAVFRALELEWPEENLREEIIRENTYPVLQYTQHARDEYARSGDDVMDALYAGPALILRPLEGVVPDLVFALRYILRGSPLDSTGWRRLTFDEERAQRDADNAALDHYHRNNM